MENIVHELKGGIPKEGETVQCIVDSKRREGITKHHTSTHILKFFISKRFGFMGLAKLCIQRSKIMQD